MGVSENEMVMPVAPMNYGGVGNGMMMNNDLMLMILFLFAFTGGGWGGNNGNISAQMQDGFNQTAVMGSLGGLQASVNNGFSTAEVAACNRAMDAMQVSYNNQIAGMNQNFAMSQDLNNRLDSISMALQNCCCDNRASIADVKYTIATEACNDRAALAQSTQRILDQMCQDKIDAKNEQISQLRTQLSMSDLAASQTAQTAQLMADNARQTALIEQYIAPAAAAYKASTASGS